MTNNDPWGKLPAMRILLLDEHWPQTAWFVQEMHRQGIEVVYASPGLVSARGLGRYCRHRRFPRAHQSGYREFLLELLESQPFDVILPLCEPLQRLAWDLPAPFASRVFPHASSDQRRLLDDRCAMYALAATLQVPIPRMLPISGADDLDALAHEFGWPMVLRGTQGVAGQQVRIVQNRAQALAAYQLLIDRSPDPPFGQQFICGHRSVVGVLLDNGTALRVFAHRSLETYPGPTGPSIRARSIDDRRLIDYAQRLFAALKWNGLALAEFMHSVDDEYYLMEINPRPWATIQVAEACGAPMIEPFVRLLRGRRLAEQRPYVVGREVVMFPAFLTARIRAGRFPSIRDAPAYSRLWRTIPGRHAGLLWHMGRNLYWDLRARSP